VTPTLHPAARELLAQFEQAGLKPYDQLTVLQARANVAASVRQQRDRTPVALVRDVLVDGEIGRLPTRIYHPAPDEVRPLVIYLHGGGFVAGGIAPADRPCRALAAASGWVIASVEYRLAPENPHPAPARDSLAATRWLVEHAAELGADGSLFVLMGDSAGGALAAATAIALRDTDGPRARAQVLVYPTLTPTRDAEFPSLTENGEGYSMTRGGLEWFWDHLLSGPGAHEQPPAAPLDVADLAALPPATVVVAEFDPLRDEGLAYVERLTAAGVPARAHLVEGAIHGFWWMDAMLPQADELTGYLAVVLAELGAAIS
jgi:acetyl esterase